MFFRNLYYGYVTTFIAPVVKKNRFSIRKQVTPKLKSIEVSCLLLSPHRCSKLIWNGKFRADTLSRKKIAPCKIVKSRDKKPRFTILSQEARGSRKPHFIPKERYFACSCRKKLDAIFLSIRPIGIRYIIHLLVNFLTGFESDAYAGRYHNLKILSSKT